MRAAARRRRERRPGIMQTGLANRFSGLYGYESDVSMPTGAIDKYHLMP
jgi:hypothetical protein